MGQKSSPIGLRLGINKTWDSRWFATGVMYVKLLNDDIKIRRFVQERLKQAQVTKVVIERPPGKCRVTVHTARPGVVIGKRGGDIERMRVAIAKITDSDVQLSIADIRKPEMNAQLIAYTLRHHLMRRIPVRRAIKRQLQAAMRSGAEGIRIACAGRLNGIEIARTESSREGRVPLHTFRSDIDYGCATAKTVYGTCGVKVWVCKGEILGRGTGFPERRSGKVGEPSKESAGLSS